MNRVEELEKLIKHHKILYYSGRAEISDFKYDELESELRKLDPENFLLQTVGTEIIAGKKVKHEYKMLSLDKTYDEKELESWMGNNLLVSTFKLDGVACSLIYEKNRLIISKTRGDGVSGEDITAKVLWVEAIPKIIKFSEEKIEIRGELYCTEEDFLSLCLEMEKEGLEKPNSPRNIVAGLMGRKENLELCRFIRFQAFDLIIPKKNLKSEMEKFEILKSLKFEVPEVELHQSFKSVKRVIDKARSFMSEGDYNIDGLVFTINDLECHDQLGSTAHHPRYKMAFKFQGESARTVIKEIQWSVSRYGVLTPVAIVEAVNLSGAKISRVTLHNYGLVKQFELKSGDEIEIVRSGEVIPKFISLLHSSSNKFEIPLKCPSCNSKVEVVAIRLLCVNPECPGKAREGILNFIQKIGIEDLSGKRLDELIKLGLVNRIPDLYRLKTEDFLKLEKVQTTLATKLYNNISNSKNVDLIIFLAALGISGGAYNKCEKVYQAGHNTIEKVMNLTREKLMQVESFAEKSSLEFYVSLREKIPLIEELLSLGLTFNKIKHAQTPITGKKICITGALSEKRSVIEDKIREAGGIVVSSVSENTSFLITNEKESSSTKFLKAKKLGVPILSEGEFLELLN